MGKVKKSGSANNASSVEIDKGCPEKGRQCTGVASDSVTGQAFSTHLNFTEGSSDKFYIMQLLERYDGSFQLYSRYGRNGADGQITSKLFSCMQQGKAAYHSLLKSKTGKGYQVVVGSSTSSAPTSSSSPADKKSGGDQKGQKGKKLPAAITSVKPAKKSGVEPTEGSECVVCLTEEKCMVVVPCGHKCMCEECSKQLQKGSKLIWNFGDSCPVCRGKIQSFIKIYE